MRILITRPAADAERTAAALRARGHDAVVAPLLTVEFLSNAELGDGSWSAILFTSANAARAIAGHKRRDELRRIPAFAVGKQSAQQLRAEGFANVASANGDGDDLAALVAARLEPAARLLYLAGEDRAGDLAGALRAKNFIVDSVVVYRVVAAAKLPAEAVAALAGKLDGVLHYSQRSAAGVSRRRAPIRAARSRAWEAGTFLSVGGGGRAAHGGGGRECAHRGPARRGRTRGIMRLNQRDYAGLLGFIRHVAAAAAAYYAVPRGLG